jgi:mRNA-degrading endonuclease RelE of RelBE toxin-antitoxin system
MEEFLAPARERPFGVAAGMMDDGKTRLRIGGFK